MNDVRDTVQLCKTTSLLNLIVIQLISGLGGGWLETHSFYNISM